MVVVHGGRGVDLGIEGTRLDDGVGKRVMGDARCCNAPPVVVRAPALFLSPLLSETHPGSYFFSLAFIIFLLLPASASRIVYSCPFRFCSFVLEEKRAEPRGYLFNYHYLLFINNPIVPNDLHWLPCTCLRSSSRLKPPKESSVRRFLAPLAAAFSTQHKLTNKY